MSEIILFTGTSHPDLAQQVAEALQIELGKMKISQFPDGETSVAIEQTVRGKDVFVVQSLALNPNHYLMELLIVIDALRRASAQSISVVIAYFAYSRQDRKDRPRVPITARLVADLLEAAGATHVLTVDLHAPQVEGFFSIPVDNLAGSAVILQELRRIGLDNLVVAAPDNGSVKIAHAYATALGAGFVIIDKERHSAAEVKVLNIIGDVAGKNVLLADDMCATGGTLVSAAKACHEKGARHVYAAVTHGVFAAEAVKKIEESPLKWVLSTDTVPVTSRLDASSKIRVVPIAPLIAEAIRCSLAHSSLSSLCRAAQQ